MKEGPGESPAGPGAERRHPKDPRWVGKRVMLVGNFSGHTLESSYQRAFQSLGCSVDCFDMGRQVSVHCRGGTVGRRLNALLRVEPWIRRANRNLVLKASEFAPHLVVTFGESRAQVGSLAQVKVMCDAAVVLVWPDTLVNLDEKVLVSLPLLDLVGTYGQGTIGHFVRLGARNAEWIPLAADTRMCTPPVLSDRDRAAFGATLSFVGQWRPDREAVLEFLQAKLGPQHVRIWGPDWGRRAGRRARQSWQGKIVLGEDYSKVIAASRISLNVIDPTNYPSANMRFFEIAAAGGVQICSSCPELEPIFKHGESVLYYRDLDQLGDLARTVLSDASLAGRLSKNAHETVLRGHTYESRATRILDSIFAASLTA